MLLFLAITRAKQMNYRTGLMIKYFSIEYVLRNINKSKYLMYGENVSNLIVEKTFDDVTYTNIFCEDEDV